MSGETEESNSRVTLGFEGFVNTSNMVTITQEDSTICIHPACAKEAEEVQ